LHKLPKVWEVVGKGSRNKKRVNVRDPRPCYHPMQPITYDIQRFMNLLRVKKINILLITVSSTGSRHTKWLRTSSLKIAKMNLSSGESNPGLLRVV
jgi:hypothetical protein